MNVGNVFFALCSLVALIGAAGTVFARSPIRGAVGLLVTIVGIAGLFLKLNAEFLAAIQLIVYAGAVVVLFVFVIMLLGPDADTAKAAGPPKRLAARAIAGALLAVLAVIGTALWFGGPTEPTRFARAAEGHGTVESVGTLLFTRGLVVFELSTALLIVAVVGAIAVARSRNVVKQKKHTENATRRLFHGPVHPRDAGRPLPKEGLS